MRKRERAHWFLESENNVCVAAAKMPHYWRAISMARMDYNESSLKNRCCAHPGVKEETTEPVCFLDVC